MGRTSADGGRTTAPDDGRSDWQRRIAGTWHGLPAVFEPDGTHLGFVRVDRTVQQQANGDPEIVVHNTLDFDGAVGHRIGAHELVLRAVDTSLGRVYDGRDFHGAGRPFGRLLVGRDFITEWNLDTVVAVQVMPDGVSQLYSNLAYQGPRLVAALGGLYVMDPDDPDAYRAAERRDGPVPFAWSDGVWEGEVEVHDGTDGRTVPMTVSVAGSTLTFEGGGLERAVTARAVLDGNDQYYDGPDVFGNATAYGRMLHGTRHVRGTPLRLETREVLLHGGRSLAVAWQHWLLGDRTLVVNGVLDKKEG